VCGAGISGLYTALKFKEKFPDKSVCVLEKSSRIGGRIKTEFFEESPGTPIELGAMRFLNNHKRLKTLLGKLKISYSEFPIRDVRYNLRQKKIKNEEFCQKQVPYKIREKNQGFSPEELIMNMLEEILEGDELDKLSNLVLDKTKHASKISQNLSDVGFLNLLYENFTSEEVQFIVDASGYDSNFFNFSAGHAIKQFIKDFNQPKEQLRIDGGMSTLIEELTKKLLKMKVVIEKESSLETINKTKDGEYSSQVKTSKGDVVFQSSSIVLALPKSALKKIVSNSSSIFGKFDSRLLDSVTSIPAFKLFFQYNKNWWNKLDLDDVKFITDNPLRTSYFNIKPSKSCKKDKPVMLAAYSDLQSYFFWGAKDSSFSDSSKAEVLNSELSYIGQKLLRDTFSKELPDYSDSKVQMWSSGSQEGAAYHSWKPSVDSWEVMKKIIRPVESEDIFICGESYSPYQCWIEGALLSVEYMFNALKDKRIESEKKAA
jgi:monoamine oxidase